MIKENIEGIGERTVLEKGIQKYINVSLNGERISKNFMGVVVDIYNTDYGKICHITVVFKKPFKMEDSDLFREKIKNLIPEIKTFFSLKMIDISTSNSTIESYKSKMWWFEENKIEKK